jgi:hypothetical protein
MNDSFQDDTISEVPPKPPWAGLKLQRHVRSPTSQVELDSHADTCSFGNGAYIVADTGQTISVSGFIDTLGKVKRVPIVTAAVAYDDPNTYQTYVLFFHQVLYMDKLEHHLLCPAQLRANQITVNDVPLLHTPAEHRTPAAHSIITRAPHESLHIPLQLQGTTSYFNVRKPTFKEVQSSRDSIHVHMTSDQEWDPYDKTIHHAEQFLRASLAKLPHERGGFDPVSCQAV